MTDNEYIYSTENKTKTVFSNLMNLHRTCTKLYRE